MSLYKINRWDVVMFGNSTTKVPMIYIKPDLTFLEFARENNFALMCEINGTDTIYDGKKIPGVVDKSCHVPNCRPNFCDKTGFYVISLWADWHGYPNVGKEGTVRFSGMKAPEDTSYRKELKPLGAAAPHKMRSAKFTKGMDKTQIALLAVAIILVILLVFVLTKVLRKSNRPIQ